MKKNIDLSIIIVNYNTRELLQTCLRPLVGSNHPTSPWQIIVIDNGSTDGSSAMVKQEFPDVACILLRDNLGYAVANNEGIKKARGRYILLLNSDTQSTAQAIRSMISFMDGHPRAYASGCKLVLTDGSMDPACHRGFPTPWAALTYFFGFEKLFPSSKIFGQYHQGYKDMSCVHEVDSVTGAFFLVRREVISQVGSLDEDFFMYGEDLDWAYRIKQAGGMILFNPAVTVFHRKKQSGRENSDLPLRRRTESYFYHSMKIFYNKHYRHRYGFLITQLVLLGIFIKSKLS